VQALISARRSSSLNGSMILTSSFGGLMPSRGSWSISPSSASQAEKRRSDS
jgi:hypothetical protein